MSTRYVWSKNTKEFIKKVTQDYDMTKYYSKDSPPVSNTGLFIGYFAEGIKDNKDGTFDLSGELRTAYTGTPVSSTQFPYCAYDTSKVTRYGERNSSFGGYYWHPSFIAISGSIYSTFRQKLTDDTSSSTALKYNIVTAEAGRGSFIEDVSSSASGGFPQNGEKNGYWYTYKGNDSIDPDNVKIDADEIRPNKYVRAVVTPHKNTYGGIISYWFQYSINNGSDWIGYGAETTDITKEILVPENAKQFNVRVQARDNMGFHSSTYVYAGNRETERINAYVGITDKARKATEMYIGVNGVARKVIAGYVGDANGKARKWF